MTTNDPVLSSAMWRAFRLVVLDAAGWACQIRGPRCTAVATHVDHIIDRADGGAVFDTSNVRASCATCNGRRSADRTNDIRRAHGNHSGRWYKTTDPTYECRM